LQNQKRAFRSAFLVLLLFCWHREYFPRPLTSTEHRPRPSNLLTESGLTCISENAADGRSIAAWRACYGVGVWCLVVWCPRFAASQKIAQKGNEFIANLSKTTVTTSASKRHTRTMQLSQSSRLTVSVEFPTLVRSVCRNPSKEARGQGGLTPDSSGFPTVPQCCRNKRREAWEFAWVVFPLNMENLGQFLRAPRWHDNTTTCRSELVCRSVRERGELPSHRRTITVVLLPCALCYRQNPLVAGMVDVAVG